MIKDEDLTIKQIDPPIDNWCCSGHKAPDLFKREGPDSLEEPTRFFHIISKDINGVYCEICLIIANFIKNKQRK